MMGWLAWACFWRTLWQSACYFVLWLARWFQFVGCPCWLVDCRHLYGLVCADLLIPHLLEENEVVPVFQQKQQVADHAGHVGRRPLRHIWPPNLVERPPSLAERGRGLG